MDNTEPANVVQVDAQRGLRHLLTLDGLSGERITHLLDRAEQLR
jgi:hypothetical protein